MAIDFSKQFIDGNIRSDYRAENLTDVDFSHATLINCDFSGLKLEGCNFSGTAIKKASFSNSRIRNCIIKEAKLKNISYEGAVITDTSFFQSVLQVCSFSTTTLNLSKRYIEDYGSAFQRSQIDSSTLSTLKLINNVDLRNTFITKRRKHPINITTEDLKRIPFSGSVFPQDFIEELLNDKNFDARILLEAGITLHNVDLSYRDLSEALIGSILLENINMQGAGLLNSEFVNAQLSAVNLANADLAGIKFTDSQFSGIISGKDARGLGSNQVLHSVTTFLNDDYVETLAAGLTDSEPFPIVLDINLTDNGFKIVEIQDTGDDFGYAHCYGSVNKVGQGYSGIVPTIERFYKDLSNTTLDSSNHPFLLKEACTNKALERWFWKSAGLQEATYPQARCSFPVKEGTQQSIFSQIGGDHDHYIIKPIGLNGGNGIVVSTKVDLEQNLQNLSPSNVGNAPIYVVEPLIPSTPIESTNGLLKHGTMRRFTSALYSGDSLSLAHHGRAYWKLAKGSVNSTDLLERFISNIHIDDNHSTANASSVELETDKRLIKYINTVLPKYLKYVLEKSTTEVVIELIQEQSEADNLLGLYVLKNAFSAGIELDMDAIADSISNIDVSKHSFKRYLEEEVLQSGSRTAKLDYLSSRLNQGSEGI